MNETFRASFRSIVPLLSVIAIFALTGTQAHAQIQTAPANASIGNQASASYTDGSNISRTATSNTVVTTVLQVPGLSLTANNTKVANPGSPVYYPHTVTNTGNGTDTYTLTPANAGGDQFDLTGLNVYADTDGNGIPDNNVAITTTPALAPGESYRFVVSGTIPPSATSTQFSLVTITATTATAGGATQSNTDRVTITNNAAIEITKSISSNSGPAGSGPLTYTLTYRNTGNAAATTLNIADQIPANVSYVPGSGRWSKTATVLTDPTGDLIAAPDGTTINYSATTTGGGFGSGAVLATITSVPAQSSGFITFQINVDSGIAPQTINNQATFNYNDGAATQTGNSNTVPFTVTTSAGVTLGDFLVDNANQGAAIPFNDLLTNNGNAPDTFNITLDTTAGTNTFPAGTTFKFFKSDGVTPLVDTNRDGIVDSGSINPGAANSTTIVLVAQLPNGQVTGPFTATVIARSVNNPAIFDPGVNRVNTINAGEVEITNAGGAGAGPIGAAPVTVLSGVPGTTQRFTLNVQNKGGVSDTYTLQFSNTQVFTPNPVALPAGFTVTFRDANGAVITNTGVLPPAPAAGNTRQLFADVFIPANASSGNVEVYFRAFSPTSGLSDTKWDRVIVNNVAALTVEPNNFGQVFPGGTITYPHVISNNGNSVQTNVALTTANSNPGFTSVVYFDANGDGILQPSESTTPFPSIASIPAGGSVNVIVKVFAPAGVDPNTANVTTLTGTSAGGQTDTATDTTTVVSGDLKVDKQQAIDSDGPGAGAFGAYTRVAQNAPPGAYVRYQITVTNTGNAAVSTVFINDSTPGYTLYSTAAQPATLTVNGVAAGAAAIFTPGNGNAGAFKFDVGSLAPGASAVATFGVRINLAP